MFNIQFNIPCNTAASNTPEVTAKKVFVIIAILVLMQTDITTTMRAFTHQLQSTEMINLYISLKSLFHLLQPESPQLTCPINDIILGQLPGKHVIPLRIKHYFLVGNMQERQINTTNITSSRIL